MMLLNIYLGATAISCIIEYIFAIATSNKLKREGYKVVNVEKSFSEKIASDIYTIFLSLIPFVSILSAIDILFMGDEEYYEYAKGKLLAEGKIYIPTGETLISEETNYTENADTEKKYSEMTLEEKLAYLEREKEILTNYSKTIVSNPVEDVSTKWNHEEQHEPVLKITLNSRK